MPDATPSTETSSTETTDPGYALWAVLRRNPQQNITPGDLQIAVDRVEAEGVVIRGFYDVSGLRADADLMIWLHGAPPEKLQWALRELRRNKLISSLIPTWSAMGVHRDLSLIHI